jgi:membrane dipeptidase
VFDLHSDILLRVIDYDIDMGKPPRWPQVTIPNMRKGNVRDQVMAVWVNSNSFKGADATKRAFQMIDRFHDQANRYPLDIALAQSVAEAEEIKSSGRIACWLWIEGGAPIDNDLAMLRSLYRAGVRGMTLTWSDNLDWAGSSTDKQNPDMGLTDFGRDVVREMNRLGMIVDVSHVSDRTFFDVLEVSKDPVVASHSGCRALCDHPRDLTDDQLRALAKNGGVVGIVALPEYLKDNWASGWEAAEKAHEAEITAAKEKWGGDGHSAEYREDRRLIIQANLAPESKVTLETYVDHIDHALRIAGEDHVAVGADFDGMWAFPEGFERASQWQDIVASLRKRGWSEEVVNKVMHENARRVFREVIDK